MVTLPPRHGKSTLISHYFPVWFFDRFPARNILLNSYAAEFAKGWGRKVRNTAREHEDILRFGIQADSRRADEWHTTAGGMMKTAGIGGDITGRGFDVGIIDDPVKNAEEAFSQTIRDRHWDWFTSTFYTRAEPDASIVVLQTRWHDDDLAGRILRASQKGEIEPYEHINFPALATVDDHIGRRPGEALWPNRYDREALLRIKRALQNGWAWHALYQQNPFDEAWQMFPRRCWGGYGGIPTALRDQMTIVHTWDTAFKDLKSSSYVVGLVLGFVGGACYVLDYYREHADFPATVRQMLEMVRRNPSSRILIEDKANGSAIISALQKHLPGIEPVEPRGSKEARAAAVQPFCRAGSVRLPAGAPWLDDWFEEFEKFPRGTTDDIVDALSQALARMWLEGAGLLGGIDLGLGELLVGNQLSM